MVEKKTFGDDRHGGTAAQVTKVVGADCELGNFILGLDGGPTGTAYLASRALLKAIDGIPGSSNDGVPVQAQASGYTGYTGYTPVCDDPLQEQPTYGFDPQDVGRKYLASNGSCVYIDLNHLEICTPEVTSARDFTANWHAMLTVARRALVTANVGLSQGQRIIVLANSSDGHGRSYGSHLNFLVTRRFWDDLFLRRMHPELFVLMAYQVSSIVCTGQGKVGAENGRTSIDYQISQRADFIETLVGPQTTVNRPLVNSRDEPLCGTSRDGGGTDPKMARLHCIFYDSTLCHVGTFLKVGVMQLVLAMLEAGWLDRRVLILEDPLAALYHWSRDPGLQARARLSNGVTVTAVELQLYFLEAAKDFAATGVCERYVPEAGRILDLWEDTLEKLAVRDFQALASRLDWVLKKTLIERALEHRPELTWASPEIRHLDHLYCSLDEREGLYWVFQDMGLVERVVGAEDIDHALREPPEDTRAYTRARLLRAAGQAAVASVDWDQIKIRMEPRSISDPRHVRTLAMSDPLSFSRSETESLFDQSVNLNTLLIQLGAEQTPSSTRWLLSS